ncbi:hypothetical protein [Butyrivibrio sp. MB2005]|uniref:hypothetical protein n=1 Tax=Butyrivibrio sp. MB2005 TaxID=1280678 RepID=UPI0003F9D0CB|nr:hypothetical protein [Butyrivibrio sp. MB2005]
MRNKLDYYKMVVSKNPAYEKALVNTLEEMKMFSASSDNIYCAPIPKSLNAETDMDRVVFHYLHTFAPVLVEFTEWVLKSAEEKGIRKLYFLSRDAYPVYLVARCLTKEKVDFPELHYLRVSRYALRIPEMSVKKKEFPEKLFLSGIDVTMRKIFKRGGLTDTEAEIAAKIIGYTDPPDKILLRPEILAWKQVAYEHIDELWELIQRHAESLLPKAMGYFDREGMFDGLPMAIVDSGWVGTTQQSILNLLRTRKSDIDLCGYYFGLYETPKSANPQKYNTFYFSPRRNIGRKVNFSNCLFEAVSSETAGMTLGYEKYVDSNYVTDDSNEVLGRVSRFFYEPVISESGNLNNEFLTCVNTALEVYAKNYRRFMNLNNGESISEDILVKLMTYPDEWEAKTYGNLLFCDDVLETDAQHIAADLSYEDICNLRLLRKLFLWIGIRLKDRFRVPNKNDGEASRAATAHTVIHESGWIYASIVKCGRNVVWSLLCARFYNLLMYLRKRITIMIHQWYDAIIK